MMVGGCCPDDLAAEAPDIRNLFNFETSFEVQTREFTQPQQGRAGRHVGTEENYS